MVILRRQPKLSFLGLGSRNDPKICGPRAFQCAVRRKISSEQVVVRPVGPVSIRGHVAIARLDHWYNNVFVLPGIVIGLGADLSVDPSGLGLGSSWAVVGVPHRLEQLHAQRADRRAVRPHHPTNICGQYRRGR